MISVLSVLVGESLPPGLRSKDLRHTPICGGHPRNAPVIGLLFIGCFLLLGCPKVIDKPDAAVVPECENRDQCSAGKVCTSDKFCANCETSGQCTLKENCDAKSKLCTLREGWGTACKINDECQAGFWCKQGLCVDRAQVTLCPGGLNSECPQGERCNRVTTVCEEDLGCSTNDDCSAGEVCNTGSRACVPKCTMETQSTICAAGERCVDSKCVQCAGNAECGVGLVCDNAGRCSAGARCYTDRDCNVPLACFVQTGACLPKQPPCISNDNCLANQRCDVGNGRCIPKDCQPDRYEPNNDDVKAFNVAPGSYRNLSLCLNDVDWYSISLSRGDQLGINLDADAFSENTYSTVVKAVSGRTLSAGKLLVSYVAPANAKYFVVVSNTDAFQSYDITFLKSRGVPCDDDALEPNDVSTQATALNVMSQADGKICPQDVDWFKANVPMGKTVKASLVNYDSSKGLLRLCASSLDGMSMLGCSNETNPLVNIPVGQTQVLLRVLGETERNANAYTLKVEFL
jgi:hypothetical protein